MTMKNIILSLINIFFLKKKDGEPEPIKESSDYEKID